MNNYIFLIFAFALLISCRSNEKKQEHSFENLEPIKLEGTEILENVLGTIYLHPVDSLIIVSTKNKNSLYRVYDRQGNFITSFGKLGQGPDEIPFPPPRLYETFGDEAFIYISQLLTWVAVDLKVTIETDEIVVDRRYEFPKELSGARDIFKVNDTLITGIYDDHFTKRIDEKRGVFLYYPGTGSYELLPVRNFSIEPYEAMPATNINAKAIAVSPDRTRLAIVSVFNPLLEVVDLENKSVTEYILNEDTFKEDKFDLEKFISREEIQHYGFVDATEKYLYLLYSGYPENTATEHEQKIHVLNWNGTPVKQYLIPEEYSLTSFFIDEQNNELIGHSIPDDKAYKFSLQE